MELRQFREMKREKSPHPFASNYQQSICQKVFFLEFFLRLAQTGEKMKFSQQISKQLPNSGIDTIALPSQIETVKRLLSQIETNRSGLQLA